MFFLPLNLFGQSVNKSFYARTLKRTNRKAAFRLITSEVIMSVKLFAKACTGLPPTLSPQGTSYYMNTHIFFATTELEQLSSLEPRARQRFCKYRHRIVLFIVYFQISKILKTNEIVFIDVRPFKPGFYSSMRTTWGKL